MTHPHYYASTSRNLDRVLQYGVYPFAYMVGLAINRDNAKATQWARLSGAAASALLTTTFLGLESQTMDSIVRDAVSAEMGIDSDKFKTSDCRTSQNIIAREGYKDMMALQPKRYLKDAMFLLPTLVEFVYAAGNKGKPLYPGGPIKTPMNKEVRASFDTRSDRYDKDKYSTFDILANGHMGWDMAIYTATSAYWGYETFMVNKKSYYPVAQDIVGKLKPTDANIYDNHLIDVYQRARHDRHLPMIESKEEHAALKPLIKRLADAYNEHDGKMDVGELVYLIGMGKINIHGPDQKTVSAEAVAQSNKEIDKILSIGLKGIREENRLKRAEALVTEGKIAAPGNAKDASFQQRLGNLLRAEKDHGKSFVDKVADASIRGTQGALSRLGMLPKRPESYISAQDPTELIGADSAVPHFRGF